MFVKSGLIDDVLGGIGNFFTDALRNTVSALIQGVTEAVKWVSTYFLYLPAPKLQGEGSGMSPAERVQEYTHWAVIVAGMIGMAFALIMVARRKDADSVVDVTMGLLRVVLVTGAGIPTINLAAQFFDSASPWLLNTISGGTFEDGLGTLVGLNSLAVSEMSRGILVLMLVALVFGVLGGILNLFMVMFNWGVLPVVAGLLPVLAAAAMSERGKSGFQRVVAWIVAILLFKPVAAVIYGVGIASGRMITGGVQDGGQVVFQALYGTVLLMAAGIALPAIARVVAPAVAAGTQGGGAGFLVGAAMVAAGAVTGGAAAVAAAGARSVTAVPAATAAAGTAASGAPMSPSASAAGGISGPQSGGAGGPAGGGAAAGGTPTGAGGGGSTAGGSAAAPGASSQGGPAPSGGGGGPAPSGASPSSRGSQWSRRLAANGAYQAQAQVGALENAMESGEER